VIASFRKIAELST